MPEPIDNALATRLADINESLTNDNKSLQTKSESLQTALNGYAKFGTVEEIEEAFTAHSAVQIRADEASAQLSEITEALRRTFNVDGSVDEMISSIVESHTSLSASANTLQAINEELGTVEQINEAYEAARTTIGKFQEICEALGTNFAGLVQFAKDYGTLAEITESMDVAAETLGTIKEQTNTAAINQVAAEYGKTPDEVKASMDKYNLTSPQEIVEMYQDMGVRKVGHHADITESFEPGPAMNSIISGKAFGRAVTEEQIAEARGKRIHQHDNITESNHNSPDRFARLI